MRLPQLESLYVVVADNWCLSVIQNIFQVVITLGRTGMSDTWPLSFNNNGVVIVLVL